jgi:hypothetical protein
MNLWHDETAFGGLPQGISPACLSEKIVKIVNIPVKKQSYEGKMVFLPEETAPDGGKMAISPVVLPPSRWKGHKTPAGFTILKA